MYKKMLFIIFLFYFVFLYLDHLEEWPLYNNNRKNTKKFEKLHQHL